MGNSQLRIADLKEQLGNLGYYPFQVESMIKDSIGTTLIENITKDQQEQLIQSLEACLSFAKKCKQKL